jgi:Bacteriorhodopsin-like protein
MQFDLVLATQFSFMVAFMGMIGGTFYFAMIRTTMPLERQAVAVTSAVYCLMAAVMYGYINYKYGLGTEALREGKYPTELRYIDWLVTTPLIVNKFPELLGGEEGPAIALLIIVADIMMILFGCRRNIHQRCAGRHHHRLGDVWCGLPGLALHHLHLVFVGVAVGGQKTGPHPKGLEPFEAVHRVWLADLPAGFFDHPVVQRA